MIIGVAGHVKHGKTYLLKVLTGIDGDSLPEELQRAATIEPEYITCDFCGDKVSFIDVPGHESLVRAMIAASTGIDAVLYVIDASEGIMPQTEEHTFILSILGVGSGVAALTKCDSVDESTVNKRKKEIYTFLESYGAECSAIVPVSIFNKCSIDELKNKLQALKSKTNAFSGRPFRFFADRSFSVTGVGTVVTGSITRGKIADGDELYIYPSGRVARVRRIEKGGAECGAADSGRAALNLAGVAVADVARGSVLYHKDAYQLTARFTAEVTARCGYSLKNNGIYNMFIGASKLRARYVEKTSSFILEKPFPLDIGDAFFIRGGGPETTIAGGHVVSLHRDEERRTRRAAVRRDLRIADTGAFLSALEGCGGYAAAGNIVASFADKGAFDTALKKLVAEEQIVTLENYVMNVAAFGGYVAIVRDIIAAEGFADIASFKNKSGLPRNIAAALLDKGDRMQLWQNEGNKRS